jgi:NAD(P)-dependent dehydrogenase (short-subunit alcohol dehydrogenase family)
MLEGKGAVVTGGGQGIGAAVARSLAQAGAAVVVAARTRSRIEAVAAELSDAGHAAWAVPCDVTDEASVRALAEAAAERLGHVDILINNAGTAHSAPLHKTTLEDWNRLLAVNATGAFLCARAFAPGMTQRGWGRIVTIASTAGLSGGRYVAAYAASKHAAIGLTRCVAAEVGAAGVTANAICPGWADTEMTHEAIERIVRQTGRSEDEALRAILETTNQRRLIAPAEVANLVLVLCDEAAKGINGQAIVLDGGGLLA